jgi:hypothetical protein
MTTGRSLRAGRSAAAGLALTTMVIVNTDLSAHRLDEYLQAARLAVEPNRVELELDLTPGVAVADAVIADIDRDRDGLLTADEQRAYVGRVLNAVELQIDGRPLHAELAAFTFPVLDAFRHGDGTIRLQSAITLPRLSEGDHQLLFRNRHRPEGSVYLANALVPESDQIAITGQRRDGDQRDLTINFAVRRQSASSTPVWLLGGIAGGAVLTALIKRPHRKPRPAVAALIDSTVVRGIACAGTHATTDSSWSVAAEEPFAFQNLKPSIRV